MPDSRTAGDYLHATDATGHLLCDVLSLPGRPTRIVQHARSLVLHYGDRGLEVAPQPETDTFLLTVHTGTGLPYNIITWTDAGHLQDAVDAAYADVVSTASR